MKRGEGEGGKERLFRIVFRRGICSSLPSFSRIYILYMYMYFFESVGKIREEIIVGEDWLLFFGKIMV